MKKLLIALLSVAMAASVLSGCKSSTASSSTPASSGSTGKSVTLTYAIWDTNQLAGMKAMADQFTKENPNIKVNIQVTPWDASMQYWTKLEAAAKSGSMPDVFWQHADEIADYVSANTLMDLTDKVKNSKIVSLSNFPQAVVQTSTVNGKLYGIPKDYGDLALWYNKKMFDAAGLKYPDNTWNWDTLLSAAKKLTVPSKGQYGFLAKEDGQNLYWNFIWQNGGTVISDDQTKSGYDQPAAQDAVNYLLQFIKLGYSPTQAQFANTSAEQYMQSGKAAMGIFGSWEVNAFEGSDYMKQNCDVAVLPEGKERATDLNGLCNSIAADTKHPDQAWKFVEWMGSKEANEIQGQSGAAIPAYKGTEQSWVSSGKGFNFQAYIDEVDYGKATPEAAGKPTWSQYEGDTMSKVFALQTPVQSGMNSLAKQIDDTIASSK